MAIWDVSYCTNDDLRRILPTIADYDEKRLLTSWSDHDTNIYKLGSTGEVELLYVNGEELDAAESALVDLTEEGEWFYDSDADICYYYSDSTPNGKRMEAGTDWATKETEAIADASDIVRGIVGKPILPKPNGTYDEVIVLSTAAVAVKILVSPYDYDLVIERTRLYDNTDPSYPDGFLQLINSGDLALHNEIHPSYVKGQIVSKTLNGSSTGGIVDMMGTATGDDIFKVVISAGGTLTYGSANTTVKYSVYCKDATGLMTSAVVDNELITGDYQSFAYGLSGMFEMSASGLVYTTNDVWYIRCSAQEVETHKGIHVTQLTKR